MLNRLADLVRLRTYANSLVQPISPVSLKALPELLLGDEVRGQIAAALPDGTFRVVVKDQSFLLRLPFAAQAGDVLQLHVVGREPTLRFAVAAPAESPALAANLSETARFITALLGETAKLPLTTLAAAGTPLLAAPPGERAQIIAELRQALANSGLFYESHQAQWAAGDRPLAALLQEPQAQLPPLRAAAAFDAPADISDRSDDLGNGAPGLPRLPELPHLPQLPVHRDTLNVVRHQLDTLDTRQVVWNGMIWPDQPIEWEINGRASPTPEAPEEQPWGTRLRLTLPRLGAIDATLQIAARGVTIKLHAASGEAAATLTEHQAELQHALRRAGVTPLSISVGRDETA